MRSTRQPCRRGFATPARPRVNASVRQQTTALVNCDMNWTALSAISEIIGTGAVVISLLYLASQIRTQNREARIASVHDITDAFKRATSSLQSEELASVFARGSRGFESLSETEQIRFISIFHGLFRVWEEAFYRHQHGRLDEPIWSAINAQYAPYLSLPGIQSVWAIRKAAYNPDFREFVDSVKPVQYITS